MTNLHQLIGFSPEQLLAAARSGNPDPVLVDYAYTHGFDYLDSNNRISTARGDKARRVAAQIGEQAGEHPDVVALNLAAKNLRRYSHLSQ